MPPAPGGAYVLAMAPAVRSMAAATYVRDIDSSRRFYELLGFGEVRSGTAAGARAYGLRLTGCRRAPGARH
jgi:hypothetical protein